MRKIELTIDELQQMLDEQKRIVIELLVGGSGYYNTESDDGHYRPLTIDIKKFKDQGMKASYPYDFGILKRYVK